MNMHLDPKMLSVHRRAFLGRAAQGSARSRWPRCSTHRFSAPGPRPPGGLCPP